MEKVYFPVDPHTQWHKSYGFIEFQYKESVSYSIQLLDGIYVFGRPLKVRTAGRTNPFSAATNSSTSVNCEAKSPPPLEDAGLDTPLQDPTLPTNNTVTALLQTSSTDVAPSVNPFLPLSPANSGPVPLFQPKSLPADLPINPFLPPPLPAPNGLALPVNPFLPAANGGGPPPLFPPRTAAAEGTPVDLFLLPLTTANGCPPLQTNRGPLPLILPRTATSANLTPPINPFLPPPPLPPPPSSLPPNGPVPLFQPAPPKSDKNPFLLPPGKNGPVPFSHSAEAPVQQNGLLPPLPNNPFLTSAQPTSTRLTPLPEPPPFPPPHNLAQVNNNNSAQEAEESPSHHAHTLLPNQQASSNTPPLPLVMETAAMVTTEVPPYDPSGTPSSALSMETPAEIQPRALFSSHALLHQARVVHIDDKPAWVRQDTREKLRDYHLLQLEKTISHYKKSFSE